MLKIVAGFGIFAAALSLCGVLNKITEAVPAKAAKSLLDALEPGSVLCVPTPGSGAFTLKGYADHVVVSSVTSGTTPICVLKR